MSTPITTCDACGGRVPALAFCVRCGEPLRPGRRRGFAAAPHEHHWLPAVVSTVFPHLPRRAVAHFRVALAGTLAALAVLAALGLFSLGLVGAALVAPALALIYLYDVNVYEDEPVRVLLATVAFGAAAGAGIGALEGALFPGAVSILHDSAQRRLVLLAVVLPLSGLVLSLAGPLALLRTGRFGDVLDGTTFGAASAVAFVSAQLMVASGSILDAGLRPVGDPLPWILRLLELGLVLPLIAAATVGACAGTVWLAYTRRSHRHLRVRAAATIAGAAAVTIAAAVTQLYLSWVESLPVLLVLALSTTLVLRRVIHSGLLRDAAKGAVDADVTCLNCGGRTPRHTFCGRCGIALRALPKWSSKPAAETAR